jgi:hypothetical protein
VTSTNESVRFYLAAKDYLRQAGFQAEIDWQLARELHAFTESDLLREAAWVTLCAGFSEAVVRRRFDFISLCFCDWESAEAICSRAERCKATSLTRFGNRQKIEAIISTAKFLDRTGFAEFKRLVLADPINALQSLPFIGPVTAFHLAKNLGFPTAKPDRHLQRLARIMGYSNAHQLCGALASATGDPVQLIDIVLWRFAERHLA